MGAAMAAGPRRARVATGVGLGVVIALFALDFHLDTRQRDLFSWMDPYQYYDFARGVLAGRESFDGFEIPSVFPFFVMPFLALAPGVAGALWVHMGALLVLAAGVHGLCRELSLRTPSPLVLALVLASPVLLGLSRSLYVEFTLTALASVVFLLWLRVLRRMDRASLLGFAGALALAFLTKITFPLFLAGPVAGALVARLAERRNRELVDLAGAVVLPIVLAVLLQLLVFAPSLGYYGNLVATSRPFMFLMGPAETFSAASAGYYLGEVGRSFLFLLSPLLAVPAWLALRGARGFRLRDLASPRAALWLWFLGPLLLLVAHPLKEPRHASPCVVPAVLLIVMGIEALPSRKVRRALATAAAVGAAVQYLAVTSGRVEKPYFLDRSLHYEELRTRMAALSGGPVYRATPPPLRELHWKYNQNVALAGFPANEALALSWQSFPGVVFDLDTFEGQGSLDETIPYQRFEDLYFLAAINTYNRRCGWHGYHATLSRQEVIDNADFVLVAGVDAREAARRFPDHAHRATIPREGAPIQLLQARSATTPYRALYARRFLARNPSLGAVERRTLAEELWVAAVLDGADPARLRSLAGEFPELRDASLPTRNIYWIGGYPQLLALAGARTEALSRGRPGPVPR